MSNLLKNINVIVTDAQILCQIYVLKHLIDS